MQILFLLHVLNNAPIITFTDIFTTGNKYVLYTYSEKNGEYFSKNISKNNSSENL